MSFKDDIYKIVGKTVNTVTSSVSQKSSEKVDRSHPMAKGIDAVCRKAAAEGQVLLKNEGNILPLHADRKVSVFGRVQIDTYYVGYGSGGEVNPHYTVSLIDGMKQCDDITLNTELAEIYRKWVRKNPADNGFWGHWPTCREEMPVSDALAKRAAAISDTALVVIGRAAGEDRDNTLTPGSYYLNENEEKMLSAVSRHFKRWGVILNIGGVFDFSWIEKYDVPCVLISWQGGMEAGNALADVLCGKTSPSGKLTDTIAKSYELFPSSDNFGGKDKNHYEEDIFVGYRYFETFDKDAVLFPFGYGLTYSDFSLSDISFEKTPNGVQIGAKVKNTGSVPAKNTVQLYYTVRGCALDVPDAVLCGFGKTKELAPGEEQTLLLTVGHDSLAAFDDAGSTGFCNAWVLPKGCYEFSVGFDSRNTVKAGSFTNDNETLLMQLSEACAPAQEEHLVRLRKLDNGYTAKSYIPVPVRTVDLGKRILDNLPPLLLNTAPDCTFEDVLNGSVTLEELTATLSAKELEAISRGDYTMNSPLGAPGNASVFCGVLESLRDKGIPPYTCTDGPSGIRLTADSALLPCGTAIASTWDPALAEELYSLLSEEMKERGSHVLLAPGMNIHRDPLCGRNFEYYSEDPLLTGVIAAAVVKGIQKNGASACPKHFACNNQETGRTHNDTVVSRRALREIYLKGFEICVKTAKPKMIMTSYNKINGVWSHYNYDLVTTVLRKEWGFEGCVMTDWWMRSSSSPEFPKLKDQAYRVRAGVDVLMPGGSRTGKRAPDGTLTAALGEIGGITLNELQSTAYHVLRFALETEREKRRLQEETDKKDPSGSHKRKKKKKEKTS